MSQALKQNASLPTKLDQFFTCVKVVLSLVAVGRLLEKTRPPKGFPAKSAP